MKEKMYFHGNESEQYGFLRLPKMLREDECFANLSNDAVLLYGLMLDRMDLSKKNNWYDSKNRAYIYFTIEDIMQKLRLGHCTATKVLKELERHSLIQKKRQGMGKPTIIYVLNFLEAANALKENPVKKFKKSKKQTSVKKSKKQTSRIPKNGSQDIYKTECNQTESNQTEINHTEYRDIDDKEKQIEEIKQILKLPKLTTYQVETINTWIDQYGYTPAIIAKAYERATKYKKDNVIKNIIAYINSILTSWVKDNIRTLDDLSHRLTDFCKPSEPLVATSSMSSFSTADILNVVNANMQFNK